MEGGNSLGMSGKHFHSEYLPIEDKENQEPAPDKEHLDVTPDVGVGRGTRKSVVTKSIYSNISFCM